MDKNYIYHGDCYMLCKQLDENSVDLIVADPPYFEIKGDFDYIWDNVYQYINWLKLRLLEFRRILKPTGSLYLWGAIGYHKGYALHKIADWIETNNIFKINNWITQRNCRGYGGVPYYMKTREELLFMINSDSNSYTWNNAYTLEKTNRNDLGCNNKPRKNKYKRCSDVWVDLYDCGEDNPLYCIKDLKEDQLDIWTITEASQSKNQYFKTNDNKSFPTVKALNLCNRIINSSSNPGDIVLIPFAGSGSEIVSCIINDRYFIASEIEKKYIDEIILNQRISKMAFKYIYNQNTKIYHIEKLLYNT